MANITLHRGILDNYPVQGHYLTIQIDMVAKMFNKHIDFGEPKYGPAEVRHLTRCTRKDMENWIKPDIYQPSVESFTAGGGKRLYTAEDLAVLSTMKCLSETGLSPRVGVYLGLEVAKLAKEIMRLEAAGVLAEAQVGAAENQVYALASPQFDSGTETGVDGFRVQTVEAQDLSDALIYYCAHIISCTSKAFKLLTLLVMYSGSLDMGTPHDNAQLANLRAKLKLDDSGNE